MAETDYLIRFCRDNFDLAHSISLLFRIVLGRAADAPGLVHYASCAKSGRSLRWIARQLLRCPEYRARRNRAPWWQQACDNAGEPQIAPSWLQTRAGFCSELAARPAVRRRTSLPPFGMEHYAFWREVLIRNEAELPAPQSQHRVTVSFAIFVGENLVGHLGEMCRSLMLEFDRAELLVLSAPELEAHIAREIAGLDHDRLSVSVLGSDDQVERLARAKGEFVLLISDFCVVDAGVAVDLASDGVRQAAVVSFDQDRLLAGKPDCPLLGGCFDPERAVTALPQSFFAIRGKLLEQLRLRLPADAAVAEWDLILRTATRAPQAAVVHVPKVRRTRMLEESAGPAPTQEQMIREVRKFLDDCGWKYVAVVAGDAARCVRVVHPLPDPLPLVSVIIPTRNRAELLRTCLDGLIGRTSYDALEVIVVDNGSDEPDALRLFEELSREPRVKVMREAGPFNWAAFNNHAAEMAAGQILLFLNNDVDVIHPDWLQEIASQVLRPEIGAVGAKLLYADQTVQHAGVAMNDAGDAYHAWRGESDDAEGYRMHLATAGTVSAVTGACLATRKEVWSRVGGIDERMPVTYSDVDFCFRVRAAGLRVIYTPHAKLFHLEGATRGNDTGREEWARLAREAAIFKSTWGRWSREEPWLGPNIEADGPEAKLVPRAVDKIRTALVSTTPISRHSGAEPNNP